MIEVLPSTRERLRECEAVIERGMASFIEVGNALAEIRDSRLYLDTNATFEDYCRDRWGMSRPYAYNLIDAASVSAMADIENERQARALVPLKDDADLLREVWRAISDSGEKPTAALIRKVLGTETDKEMPTDKEMWNALQTLLRGYEQVSDVERAVATIPRERHAATARRARKLGQLLAHLAYRLEHVDDHVLPDEQEMADVIARQHPSPGVLTFTGKEGQAERAAPDDGEGR